MQITKDLVGSFAPRITTEKLAEYRDLSESVTDQEVKEHLLSLCKMVEVFFETPDVSGGPLGVFGEPKAPLPADEVTRIWDHVPWSAECDMMGKLFDSLEGDARNAAYHLLWYARELTKDRQPITKDLCPPELQ